MPRQEPWRHIIGEKKEQVRKIIGYGQRNKRESHRRLTEKSSRIKDWGGWLGQSLHKINRERKNIDQEDDI